MIKEAIGLLVAGKSLTTAQAALATEEMMRGEATPAQIGSFLTALRVKGETVDEITGMARTMRANAIPVVTEGNTVDTCGTGGDGTHTFNISTAAALIAAGAGLKIAKHGNRAASSRCGSADVLEALGVKIDLNAAQVAACLQEVGIGFMFAPAFHPATKHAAGPRRELGIRTVFNILGPLTNPAGASAQLLGVADESLLEIMAAVLNKLGSRHVLVVHGQDGMDEMTVTGETRVCELREGRISRYTVTPEDCGLPRTSMKSLLGGTAEENAVQVRRLLAGAAGPQTDAALLNAGAALFAGDMAGSLRQGIDMAREAIGSGRAAGKLERLAEMSQQIGRGRGGGGRS